MINHTVTSLQAIHPKLKSVQIAKRGSDDRVLVEKTHIAYNLFKYPELTSFMQAETYYYNFKFRKSWGKE